ERLPEPMVPADFVLLPALPRTANGKLDRRALPAAAPAQPRSERPHVPPRTRMEEEIAALWREVLGVEHVGVQDNFFSLGGNSLALVRLHSRLASLLGREISIAVLFNHPTIESLARELTAEEPPPAAARETRERSELRLASLRRLHQTRDRSAAAASAVASAATSAVSSAPRLAVVGLAARYPGARSADELWRNLRDGVESISFSTVEELAAAGVAPRLLADPRYVRAKGVLPDADLFDAAFFGFTPREAEQMDPQLRVFLECAWAALEDAGCDPRRFRERVGGRVGVFAGSGPSSYLIFNLLSHPEVAEVSGGLQLLLLNDRDFLATRTSYALGLTGPSVAVQSACSTSLVAIHYACQSLLAGECDMALAGGVSISAPVSGGYLYQEGGILSPDGHCRAFDAAAAGSVDGNGCGVVVLKRLADAIAGGDPIHAVVCGSAVTNDGPSRVGFTAPGLDGQAAAISEALLFAGVDPDSIGYVQTHGSGTPLGDPVEIEALTRAFRRAGARGTGTCAIGSVKTNFGHCNTAAGAAGFLAATLALTHRTVPPSLHFERPNPRIDFASSPFYVCTEATPWEADGSPRRAGVSSFGVGGTNAHVILEEAPEPEPGDPPARPPQLLVLSAKTPEALAAAAARLADHLEARDSKDEVGAGETSRALADTAWTLQ